jgi:(p)ppGpp synthase/HD superfamily hydrolase
MIEPLTQIEQDAYIFASAAHAAVGQLRKYTNEPYIVHPVEVYCYAREFTTDSDVLAATLLHDVVEDTNVSIELVSQMFGPAIADIVAGVTDVSTLADGNRATRAAIDRNHVAAASEKSQIVKAFDIISNTSSIANLDRKFAAVYLPEKKKVAEVLTKLPDDLYKRLNEHVQKLIDTHLQ